ENDSTISGYRFSTGWAEVKKIFFVIRFSKKFRNAGISMYNQPQRNIPVALSKEPLRVLMAFDVQENESVLVKAALSPNSKEEAREYLSEIPHWDFMKVKEEARQEWNKYLSMIRVEGEEKQKEIF